jgi:hypothetical protein
VAQDRQGATAPVGAQPSYLPATLVSGIPPMSVSGTELGAEAGFAGALARASSLYDAGATPLATRRDGTRGLFIVRLAPRLVDGVVEPGFVVVFVSELWLRAAAADTANVQLTTGDAPARSSEGVRESFTEAGQRFDVVVPAGSVRGAAAVLPWLIVVAGALLAALAGALGVNAARRAAAQDELDRIFERFYRVDPARARATGGTGLGLSIVKHVAASNGGTVEVWSEPGLGSSFTLVLPAYSAEIDEEHA